MRDLVIYQDERYYCGPGPSAVQLADGTIMVAFRRAYNWIPEGVYTHGWPSTEACLITSLDGGQTWSNPRIFTGGNITNQNLTLLPDGTLICITQRGETLPLHVYERLKEGPAASHVHPLRGFGFVYAAYGVQVMRSTDGGLSWEGPFFVSPIPGINPVLPGWPSPAGLRASAIPLQDGSVGVAVYGHSGPDRDASKVWFMVSPDRGETWEARGCIVDDPEGQFYYNETGVYQCASGKLVDVNLNGPRLVKRELLAGTHVSAGEAHIRPEEDGPVRLDVQERRGGRQLGRGADQGIPAGPEQVRLERVAGVRGVQYRGEVCYREGDPAAVVGECEVLAKPAPTDSVLAEHALLADH